MIDVPAQTYEEWERSHAERIRRLTEQTTAFNPFADQPKATRPVVVNGRWYPSVTEAGNETGIKQRFIYEKCRGIEPKLKYKRKGLEFNAHYAD